MLKDAPEVIILWCSGIDSQPAGLEPGDKETGGECCVVLRVTRRQGSIQPMHRALCGTQHSGNRKRLNELPNAALVCLPEITTGLTTRLSPSRQRSTIARFIRDLW